jgi:opacity protein-like surface antigen
MWFTFRPATIPTLKSVLVGSTDLGMFNAWTVGKIRWIDRDNARIMYGEGAVGPAKYSVGLFPLPSFMAPDWGSGQYAGGIASDVRRSWGSAATVGMSPMQSLNLKLTASHVIAIQQDPASTDDTVGVRRWDNNVQTLDILYTPNSVYSITGLIGVSNYSLNKPILGFATWYPHIPYADVSGSALKLDVAADDPFGIGLTLKGEYFNVGPDFVSIMAARRETKVLLSEGYVRYGAGTNGSTWRGDAGFTPSPFADNGITDWNETFYYNCVGTNGITVVPEFRKGALGIKGEVSVMSNGLNSQSVDVAKYWWSAPRVNQSSNLAAVRADYLLPFGNGLNIFGKYKMANFTDGVDTSIPADDQAMNDSEIYAGASYQLTDEIGLTGGYKTLGYVNKLADTKTYDFSGGMVFAEVKANVGGVDMAWAYEKVDGKDAISSAITKDMRIKATAEIKI